MLGLGNGIENSGGEVRRLKLSFEFVCTSSTNYFGGTSIQGFLTQTYDEDAGGEGGWQKNVYDTNQINTSGIARNLFSSVSKEVGDYMEMSFTVYLDGDWDG